MPKNPKPEQRMAWHAGHAANCGCRPIPAGVIRLFADRGLPVPAETARVEAAGQRG